VKISRRTLKTIKRAATGRDAQRLAPIFSPPPQMNWSFGVQVEIIADEGTKREVVSQSSSASLALLAERLSVCYNPPQTGATDSNMTSDVRWSVRDKNGRAIHLTEDRWQHIVERHPEMSDHEEGLQRTIRVGRRTQDSLSPNKYFYREAVPNLPEGNTHIEAIVVFRFTLDEGGNTVPNNFVVTAYPIFIGQRR